MLKHMSTVSIEQTVRWLIKAKVPVVDTDAERQRLGASHKQEWPPYVA